MRLKMVSNQQPLKKNCKLNLEKGILVRIQQTSPHNSNPKWVPCNPYLVMTTPWIFNFFVHWKHPRRFASLAADFPRTWIPNGYLSFDYQLESFWVPIGKPSFGAWLAHGVEKMMPIQHLEDRPIGHKGTVECKHKINYVWMPGIIWNGLFNRIGVFPGNSVWSCW